MAAKAATDQKHCMDQTTLVIWHAFHPKQPAPTMGFAPPLQQQTKSHWQRSKAKQSHQLPSKARLPATDQAMLVIRYAFDWSIQWNEN